MLSILFLITMLREGCHSIDEVQRGSDMTLQCDVPLLSESSTLQWIKDSGQTFNTTLVYNNSAYIILHNVDETSEGKYYCRLTEDGSVETVKKQTVSVTKYSENKRLTIYRQSLSELSLICKSKKEYHRLMWIVKLGPNSKTILIAVEKGGKVQVEGPIKPGRKTSTTYNSQMFLFHISPVKFNYSGTYKCIVNDDVYYTTTILHTIRVSAEPPGGVLMNKSVVLTCEVSDVTDSVMLAWLRMQGDRGVLVEQQILNEKDIVKKRLTVNVSSIQSDLLHWQCAVFTENKLRAVAPITISLISNHLGTSTETSTSTYQDNTGTQDSHVQIMILLACSVTASVLILLGLLVFKCQRKTFADGTSVTEMRPSNTSQTDPVGTDEGRDIVLKSREEEEELHYASVTVAGCSHGANSLLRTNASSKVLDNSSTVIYSAIKIQ